MLNCAICDDDISIVQAVNEILIGTLRESDCIGKIETYTDSISFLSDVLEYKPLDLVILDIEMPN